MGNAFRGEYVDPGFQDYFSIPVMGVIDDKGKVNGISGALLPDGEIIGTLSGQINGKKFHVVWSPMPDAISEFREMDMALEKLPRELEEEIGKHPDAFYNAIYPENVFISTISGEPRSRAIPFLPVTHFTALSCGYTVSEQEKRTLYVTAAAKPGEVQFQFHIRKNGQHVEMAGIAPLKGNRFRYKEQGYEFEASIYNDFIVLKTISGNLQGFKADGVYPAQVEQSYYLDQSIMEDEPTDTMENLSKMTNNNQ
jgi:hypothetical protein